MKRFALRAPSPATAVSLVALFVALGGTSYAAFALPKNSVGTKQLKNKAVTLAKVAPAARGALTKVGPRGNPGPQGPQGPPGAQGTQGQTGPKGADFTAATTLPSGKTETGVWAVTGSAAGAHELDAINFRIPLASPVTHIEFHVFTVSTNCPGPRQAAPGYLCIYSLINGPTLVDVSDGFGVAQAGPEGFTLALQANTTDNYGFGNWAVTAP